MEEFLNKLKNIRESKGLTISDVSSKTMIRSNIIKDIENGRTESYSPVYLKSFIKTYAKFLAIPDEEINEALQVGMKTSKKSSKKKAKNNVSDDSKSLYSSLQKKKKITTTLVQSNIINYVMYFALGLAAVALLYFALFSTDPELSENTLADYSSKPDTAVIKQEDDEGLLSWFEKPDSLILEARAIDTAWIRIQVDGIKNEQLMMLPGMDKRWAAKEYFILSIGNVGGVEFRRNNQLLEPFGAKGSVVRNLKISADKIENSSMPWSKPKRKKQKKEQPKLITPSTVPSAKPNIRRDTTR